MASSNGRQSCYSLEFRYGVCVSNRLDAIRRIRQKGTKILFAITTNTDQIVNQFKYTGTTMTDLHIKVQPEVAQEFKSIDEIQEFWDDHSSADYWDEMEDVDLQLSPALQAKLELRKLYRLLGLSSEQIAAIESKARSANMSSKQLISKWILENV